MKCTVCPTSRRGDSHLRTIHHKCSLYIKKECLTTTVNHEHVVSINRHRSCELNMKFSVFPTAKRGRITSQGKIETYLDLLGGNHWLVPMLARHSSKTMDIMILLIHLSGAHLMRLKRANTWS